MNLKRCAFSFGLLLLAIGMSSVPASAQTYKATFTLPFEAVWNNVVLEPAEYTITSDSTERLPVLHVTGNGQASTILAGAVRSVDLGRATGSLELTNVNGAEVVTKLRVAFAGREYDFPVFKGAPKTMGADRRVISTTRER